MILRELLDLSIMFIGQGFIISKSRNIKNENIPIVGWFKIKSESNNFLEKYSNKYLYLVHSYECKPTRKKDVIGTYRVNKNKILCAVKNKNILGFQFHPEKSSFNGLKILKDFCNL